MARDLVRRRGRERQGLFCTEGVRGIDELLRSSLVVRGLLHSAVEDASDARARILETCRARGVPEQEVSAQELASAADTESPQGLIAIAEIPRRTLADVANPGRQLVCVLDGIQDPGNAGTIVRTAAAFGAVATLALPGTVDLWNAKVVRSSMGALFAHFALSCTWAELDAFAASRSLALWGADASGSALDDATRAARPERLAVVVGNEGAGLSTNADARVARRIALPISDDVESLNVAVAAGILLYELRS